MPANHGAFASRLQGTSASPTPVQTGVVTTTFFKDLSVPTSVYQSCGDRFTRVLVNRPCPSLDCAAPAAAATAACTPAPSDLVNPPFTAVLVDCEYQVYQSSGCVPCETNYCTRADVQSEPHAGECELGFVTTVASRLCPLRCGPATAAPKACPAEMPTYAPQVMTAWDSCVVRVGMGQPCGCDAPCTVPGNVPASIKTAT